MEFRVRGESGELRVCYQHAATLGAWSMEPAGRRTYAFVGKVLSEHSYWMTQRPLDLALRLGSTEWLWRDVSIQRSGDELRVELSEPPIATEFASGARGER